MVEASKSNQPPSFSFSHSPSNRTLSHGGSPKKQPTTTLFLQPQPVQQHTLSWWKPQKATNHHPFSSATAHPTAHFVMVEAPKNSQPPSFFFSHSPSKDALCHGGKPKIRPTTTLFLQSLPIQQRTLSWWKPQKVVNHHPFPSATVRPTAHFVMVEAPKNSQPPPF